MSGPQTIPYGVTEDRAEKDSISRPTWTRTIDEKPIENVIETDRDIACAAESGAVDVAGSNGVSVIPFQNEGDPALQLLVEVWGELPDFVKNQILKLANNAVAGVL